ncbi:hypothetical protein BC6307_12510 [Sutcliffiella cohnii]|uniref:MinD/ParA family protein n=1 Tax=Sutcliffiella cohnii TaxID=33932 RepID=A0A223KRB7_9BACI|nr:MinD/ParA family protein [Sutcliffiella cohnii]AST92041.1 hypothetical protein BC6307_12510 [Sutcliffiella cohnii]
MNDQAASLREKIVTKNNKLHFKKYRTLAIISGKGGVGKSNFSLNFSLSLQKAGFSVLLIDFDIGMANIDVLMGKSSFGSIIDLLNNGKSLRDVIQKGPEGLSYIPGGSGLAEIFKMDKETVQHLLKELQNEAIHYDYLLFDMGAGMTEENLKLLLAMDEIVVVTTCEPTSITDAYAALKIITISNNEIPLSIVVNKVFERKLADKTFYRIQSVSRKFLQKEIGFFGSVPDDRYVTKSVMEQTPFLLAYPKCNASKAITNIATSFAHEGRITSKTDTPMISKLFHLFFER